MIEMISITALLTAILALIIALGQSARFPRLKRSVDSLFEAPLVSLIALIVIVVFLSSIATAALKGESHHGMDESHAESAEHGSHAPNAVR